jgi:hypothetical protein
MSEGPFDFGTSARDRDPGRAAGIRRWAEVAFALGEDDSVMVTELRCREPGCPPLETVIALLGAGSPTRRHTIHKPMADVTEEDVRALASRAPGRGADCP